jgi:ribonuclease M5
MKKQIRYPIIVEGKYDKIKIDSLFDATVIVTNGFAIFNKNELLSLIRSLAEREGKIIILTDSDGGGHLIRSHIKTAISPDKIINLYTPKTQGKEKRKREASKEGYLGVEGISAEVLCNLLSPFTTDEVEKVDKVPITKADFYALGISGRDDSAQKRETVLKALNLPHDMSPNAMISAINILYSKEEFVEKVEKILK